MFGYILCDQNVIPWQRVRLFLYRSKSLFHAVSEPREAGSRKPDTQQNLCWNGGRYCVFYREVSRPGRSQGLLYKHLCHSFIHWFTDPLVSHSFTVIDRSLSYKIDYVIVIKKFLNPERASKSHQWFKSYGHFTEGVGFAYWWCFSGGGTEPAACAAGLFIGWLALVYLPKYLLFLEPQIMSYFFAPGWDWMPLNSWNVFSQVNKNILL